MKPSAWKRRLSYLVDVTLEKSTTPLNPDLTLALKNGRFYLTTPNAAYSYGDLYRTFSETFRLLDLDALSLRRVLMLGFGMGSVPFMLEKVFQKNYEYTGVEADEVILEWAKKYTLPELLSPVELHHADALDFVCNCNQTFDLLIVDIFIDDQIPQQFQEIDFLEKLNKLLRTGGLLLFNRLADTPVELAKTQDFFSYQFKHVFPEGSYFDLRGNWMLLNLTPRCHQ
jgi:spermidine synthase